MNLLKNNNTALLFLDVDGFTLINKKFGSEIGNRVLSELSNLISEFVKVQFANIETSVLSWNAVEFVVLVPNLEDGDALAPGREVVNIVSTKDRSQLSNELYLTVSCGVSVYRRKALGGTKVITQPRTG